MKMYTLITLMTVAAGVGLAGQEAWARGGGRAGREDAAAQQRADRREANQERRIEQGVKKGQLTPDEVTTLQGLETNIQTMENNFQLDGKLTKEESKQLEKMLNEASLQIWSERHDTEGNQKAVSRLGKDIFAQDGLTAKIESGQMTKADTRKFLGDFRRMVVIKRQLAAGTLTDAERAALQAEYNDLLNVYFTVKAPAANK